MNMIRENESAGSPKLNKSQVIREYIVDTVKELFEVLTLSK